jgi:eukaryotic-like serine/threonine-protein kinase
MNAHPASVQRLLTAIRKTGEFPAMAQTVGKIGALTSSEGTASATLADSILQDYGLTQKLLRLVNTVAYAQYDEVTTITRAVLLLGFERIRTIATTLILFDHISRQAKNPALVDILNMSFYSAILGRNIAEDTGFTDGEETFLSSLFHRLGRVLVAFYLPEEFATIETRAQTTDRTASVRAVLGASFEDVGVAVAHELNLPDKLSRTMEHMPGDSLPRSLGEAQKLASVATLANAITDVLASSDATRNRRAEIEKLVASYGACFKLPGKVDELISRSIKQLKDSSATFKLQLKGSRFLAGLGDYPAASLVAAAGTGWVAESSSPGALAVDPDADAAAGELPETILTKGLHEITSLLVGEYALDDVLRVALETIYRALGPGRCRVFFLLKDPSAPLARFRFGFGQTTSEMKSWFEVPIRGGEDLFSLSMTSQKDIVVRDLAAVDVVAALPDWYPRKGVADGFLLLLPLVVDQRVVGVFYVDGDKSLLPLLTPSVTNYLKVLRGQAVLAIKQKAGARPARR